MAMGVLVGWGVTRLMLLAARRFGLPRQKAAV
jgi:hypothetical protein